MKRKTLTNNNWDDVQRNANSVEKEIDKILVAYARVANNVSQDDGHQYVDKFSGAIISKSNEANKEKFGCLTNQLEQLLKQLQRLIDEMDEMMTDNRNHFEDTPTNVYGDTIRRHHEIIYDYQMEFNKTKNNVHSHLDRLNLLGDSVIDPSAGLSRRNDLLLKEDNSINNSVTMIEQQINVAKALKENLAHQKSILSATFQNLMSTAQQFPIINKLTRNINFRKRRDAIIIASIISFCTILLLLYAFRH
ncbi:hypothetical protein SNEBB_000832 [Seison nebaliae]|nr:hypothetical protein SNEBB_000832 [Seison nebaliae]